ncbi:MAG: sugar ABC transporter ATP-binding protein [Ostreibacterium sp.]
MIHSQDKPLVEVRNVVKTFGHTIALNGVNLQVMPGKTHALVGRNGAGKSTLVSMVTGLAAPDSGKILFSDKPAPPLNKAEEWRKHVACVYQKSTIMPNMSVAENLLMNRQDFGKGWITWSKLYRNAQTILDEWEIEVNIRAEAGSLDVESRQLMEIARALSHGTRFIILDEPTAMLDGKAIARLFDRMRRLQSQGITFLFISHHLSEVYEICQEVTVYRDAKHMVTAAVSELDQHSLIEAMTGEVYRQKHYQSRNIDSDIVFTANKISKAGRYHDINLAVKKGEIIGFAGNGGCGKIGLAESIVGLLKPDDGLFTLDGEHYTSGDVRVAIDAGIGFVPQDRHHEGFISEMSIEENTTMTILPQLSHWGFLDRTTRYRLASEWIAHLEIKTYGARQSVDGLSGGNQQKVVQARAMANQPKLLVMISPTAGVDIKSKETLLDYVKQSSEKNQTAVLIISDELDDLRACDSVLVMFHGKITHKFKQGWEDNTFIEAMEGLSTPNIVTAEKSPVTKKIA